MNMRRDRFRIRKSRAPLHPLPGGCGRGRSLLLVLNKEELTQCRQKTALLTGRPYVLFFLLFPVLFSRAPMLQPVQAQLCDGVAAAGGNTRFRRTGKQRIWRDGSGEKAAKILIDKRVVIQLQAGRFAIGGKRNALQAGIRLCRRRHGRAVP